jgi:hypothetical protein
MHKNQASIDAQELSHHNVMNLPACVYKHF